MDTFGIKNRIKKNLFIIGILLMVSCDPVQEIKMSLGNGTIHIPCGEVTISTRMMGYQLFFIEQKYDLKGELWVDPDSLEIVYKSEQLDFELWNFDNKKGVIEKKSMITGKTTLKLDFEIMNSVNIGDTIFIVSKGFLCCEGKSVLPDTISIIVDKGF